MSVRLTGGFITGRGLLKRICLTKSEPVSRECGNNSADSTAGKVKLAGSFADRLAGPGKIKRQKGKNKRNGVGEKRDNPVRKQSVSTPAAGASGRTYPEINGVVDMVDRVADLARISTFRDNGHCMNGMTLRTFHFIDVFTNRDKISIINALQIRVVVEINVVRTAGKIYHIVVVWEGQEQGRQNTILTPLILSR